jgi:ADP-dependent phosphofructokinase/glucokinase
MIDIDKKVLEYDAAILSAFHFYEAEYNRLKNKMDDSHPYLVRVKQHLRELRKEKRKL